MTPRMRAVAALVAEDGPIFDIGCGHDQLHRLLPQRRIVASDLRPALVAALPHKGAARLVADGPGALAAAPGTVVCAGLGEGRIASWLAHPALSATRRLVLNPSPQPYRLRHDLAAAGWYCAAEDLVHSGGRYHVIIAAERGRESCSDPAVAQVGPRLVESRHPLLWPWLRDCLRRRPRARKDSPETRFLEAARHCLDLAC